jgi:hypothetical protein
MTTDRALTSTHSGPITLDLTQHTGRIGIAVNPLAKTTTVTVTTAAEDGPSADGVRDATFTESGSRLTVNVPTSGGNGGGMVISGGNVIVGGYVGGSGRIVINGVDVTDVVNKGGSGGRSTEVVTNVVLPAGSEVLLSTHSAKVTVRGTLRALDFGGTSGDLRVESVGDLDVHFTSGDAVIAEVTGRLNANLTSGDLRVDAYSGSDARVALTSGDVAVRATPLSRGRFHIGLTSGDAHITGTSHLDVRRRVTSGNLRVS